MTAVIPDKEYVFPGHTACPGCGSVIAMRHTLKALGNRTILTMPASCWCTIAGAFPYQALSVPVVQCAFEAGAVTAAGIKAGLEMSGDKKTTVMAWAGDGGAFDIGIQSLSATAERNDDIIFTCNDNEGYMNTGTQKSGATSAGASTTTTPLGATKNTAKKDFVGIMVAHHIPYAATACIAFPEDIVAKVKKANKFRGTKVIHILAPCPSGWKFASDLTVKMGRLAVETNIFPLYEVVNGIYKITYKPETKPVKEYLKIQGRFAHLSDADIEATQENTDREWHKLLYKEKSQTEL